jgi:hypothetical protein
MGPLINPRWLPRDIALSLAEAGHIDAATTVAQGIIAPEWRAEALLASARAVVADRPAQALAIARRALAAGKLIADRFTRGLVIRGVARVLADAGKIDEAVAVAEGVRDPQAGAKVLADIVGVLARAGKIEAAKAVAGRATVHGPVAQAFAEAGAIGEAIEMARKTKEISPRAENLVAVAQILVRPPARDDR